MKVFVYKCLPARLSGCPHNTTSLGKEGPCASGMLGKNTSHTTLVEYTLEIHTLVYIEI